MNNTESGKEISMMVLSEPVDVFGQTLELIGVREGESDKSTESSLQPWFLTSFSTRPNFSFELIFIFIRCQQLATAVDSK